MTTKRLDELKIKFSRGQGDLNDLGEILTEFFQSHSVHMKTIKAQIEELKSNQEIIYEDINEIKIGLNPVYTIISSESEP
jgi:hypothetical protein